MSEEIEQNVEQPKTHERTSEGVKQAGQFVETGKQIAWTAATEGYRAQKHDSGMMEALTDEKVAEIKAKGGWQKFEIVDPKTTPNTNEKAVVAQNFEYDGRPPTLLPGQEMGTALEATMKITGVVLDAAGQEAVLRTEKLWNPYRGEISKEMSNIPEGAWHHAYQAFPQFKNAGLSEQQTIELMKAIVRNELYNYDKADQDVDDSFSRGEAPALAKVRNADELTIGFSQLSTNAVRKRHAEFPQQVGFAGHEREALLKPENSPILVAATLAHNLEMYQRHHVPINEQTLAYSYNPPGKRILPSKSDLQSSEHVKNILRQLAIIRGQAEPSLGER